MQTKSENSIPSHEAKVLTFIPRHGFIHNAVQSELVVHYESNILSDPLDNSLKVFSYFREIWDNQLINIQEQIYVLYLNSCLQVIGWRLLNTGSLNKVDLDMNMVMAIGLKTMAAKMMVAHNHPSKNTTPSKADIGLTKRMASCSNFFDMELVEHLIICEDKYFSFADQGLL